MKLDFDIKHLCVIGDKPIQLADFSTSIDPLYSKKSDYRDCIDDFRNEINELQEMMYAHDRYSMLLVFQAMDAAGKDSTIQHVMSGINPHGVDVYAFKRPSDRELDHDYLWRTNACMPRRGHIGIFNRSYYEEVLVARVHPAIVTSVQKLPTENRNNLDKLWLRRFSEIRNMEDYSYHNGMRIVKFFLHLSKAELRNRFLSRLNTPSKQWKFSVGDLAERERWNDYMKYYEECINATASKDCPWYIVPADDKKNMRLLVCQIVLKHLNDMDMSFPELDDETKANIEKYRAQLEAE
ncbi:MAG: polyphosphate kinase 2 family protein [Planctomycetales bacterium]|nr:polyphosphate kinase 2 family protein [Planctomycetales bacterium]